MADKPPSYDAAISRLTATGHLPQQSEDAPDGTKKDFECRNRWGSEVLIKPRGTFHLYHEEYLSSLQAREAISLAKGELKIIRDELLRLDWAIPPQSSLTSWTAALKSTNKIVHLPPPIAFPFSSPSSSTNKPSTSTSFASKISSLFGGKKRKPSSFSSKTLELGNGVTKEKWRMFEGFDAEKGEESGRMKGKKDRAKEGVVRVDDDGDTATHGGRGSVDEKEGLPAYGEATPQINAKDPIPAYQNTLSSSPPAPSSSRSPPLPPFPQRDSSIFDDKVAPGSDEAAQRIVVLKERREELLQEIDECEKVISRCTVSSDALEKAWERLEKGYELMGRPIVADSGLGLIKRDLQDAENRFANAIDTTPLRDLHTHLRSVHTFLRYEFRDLVPLLDNITDLELLGNWLDDCQYDPGVSGEKLTEGDKAKCVQAALSSEGLAVEQARAAKEAAGKVKMKGLLVETWMDEVNELEGELCFARDVAEVWFSGEPKKGRHGKVLEVIMRLSELRDDVETIISVVEDDLDVSAHPLEMEVWDLRLLYEEARWEASVKMQGQGSRSTGGSGAGQANHVEGGGGEGKFVMKVNFPPFNWDTPVEISDRGPVGTSSTSPPLSLDDAVPAYTPPSIMERGRGKRLSGSKGKGKVKGVEEVEEGGDSEGDGPGSS